MPSAGARRALRSRRSPPARSRSSLSPSTSAAGQPSACIVHVYDAHVPARTRTAVDVTLLPELADELMRIGRRRPGFVAGTELDASAYKLLWILSDGRARTLKELADELDLELSTINRQVSRPGRAARAVRRPRPPEPAGAPDPGRRSPLRAGLLGARSAPQHHPRRD